MAQVKILPLHLGVLLMWPIIITTMPSQQDAKTRQSLKGQLVSRELSFPDGEEGVLGD